ncbi:DUF402 domain-containing protein [Sporosarcina saromensis]|uniref:DUF402 domain-containing protein n=1 Tax=Sporosarcina saromensis TaxID=359365 RepID=A0ABU4G6J8_9BACL|nr:DUF402 domain-containing protein [Sporosarcina saromensis]MDW0112007.1 DUF402 domain-containing protein [Sporosarcina saromensis]
MLKRKYGSRYDWKRIAKKRYTESYKTSPQFTGYISLFTMCEVVEPLNMTYKERTVCIADKGYSWLQHFPEGKRYSVTTVFNAENQIVQWYIDICKQNGYCSVNGPWMDDLYLDLIVLPTGEIIEKDQEELDAALNARIISKQDYLQAWTDFSELKTMIIDDQFPLLEMTTTHFDELSMGIVDGQEIPYLPMKEG